jgi:hypothetical protein
MPFFKHNVLQGPFSLSVDKEGEKVFMANGLAYASVVGNIDFKTCHFGKLELMLRLELDYYKK